MSSQDWLARLKDHALRTYGTYRTGAHGIQANTQKLAI